MAVDTNVAPYYDDFAEEKNFHRILFKPGVAVQSRELTQAQTILQNQVKRVGDFLFTDGDLVQGTSPSVSLDARTVRVSDLDTRGRPINHTDYLGKFVRTTDPNSPIGLVEFTFAKDNPNIGDPISFVISLKKYSEENDDNLQKCIFGQQEELIFYDEYIDCLNQSPNIAARATTVRDIVRNAFSTTRLFSKDIILTNPTDQIEVGDILIHPLITKKIYVTRVISPIQITVSAEPEVVIGNDLVQYIKRCTSPTSILTQDVSIFYKDGFFVRCGRQKIVPDKDTSFPSKMIGLYSEQQIITSNDDNSLLDPALESSNYFANGADRLKVDLALASLNLDISGKVETTDNFIPLIKFNRGEIEYVRVTDLRSAFDDKLAERTYDESGNYVVNNFTIIPVETPEESETLVFRASSGKAYVGGYQVQTFGPTEIRIPKNEKTETIEFFNVNTNQGNYLKIHDVQGNIPPIQKVTQGEAFLELHSRIDETGNIIADYPEAANTRVGIVAAKSLEFESYYEDPQTDEEFFINKLFYYWYSSEKEAPLTVDAWADIHKFTEDEKNEALYLSGILYEGADKIGEVGLNNVSVYGLYRQPDNVGLAYWYRQWVANNKDVSLILEAFYNEAIRSGLDGVRVVTANKDDPGSNFAFLTGTNPGPFYDGVINPTKVTHIVGVSNEYTDHATAANYANPFFKAKVHPIGKNNQDQIIVFDLKPVDRLVFPLGKTYVKDVSKIQTTYKKVIRNAAFASGSHTITLSQPESFPLGDGTVTPSTARSNFLVVLKNASGSITRGAWNFESGSAIVSGSSASLTIDLGDPSYTGTADIVITVENDFLSSRIKTLTQYAHKVIDIDEADKDYSLGKSDIYQFRGVYKLADGSDFRGDWNSGTAYTYNQFVLDKGQLYRAEEATTGVSTNFANAWYPIEPEIVTDYILDNGQRDGIYDHGYIKYLGASESIPGNVIITFDYFTHSGEGPATVNSYTNIKYSDIPNFRSIVDGSVFNLRDCLDFRPRRQDDSDYFNFDTYIFPTSSVNTELTVEYYLGRKDRIYVTSGLQNFGSPYDKFFHVKGTESTDPVEPDDDSDVTKLSLCVLDIPPYTVSSFDVRFTYDDNTRYTMKDIGNINDSVIKLDKAVKLQSIEIATLKSIVLNEDNQVLLKSGIFVEDFSSLDKADLLGGYFSSIIDENNKEGSPGFSVYNLDLNLLEDLDIIENNDIVMMRYTEEPFITQDELNFTITVNPGAVDSKRGRAVISKKNSLSVNTLLTGGALLSTSIALKSIQEYITASAQGSTSIFTPTGAGNAGSTGNSAAYVGEGVLAVAWETCRLANYSFVDSVMVINTLTRLLSGPAQFVADVETFIYEFISGGFITILPALAGAGISNTSNIFAANRITTEAGNNVDNVNNLLPRFSSGVNKIIVILARILDGNFGTGLAGLQAGLNSLNARILTGTFNSLILKADAASLAAVGKKVSKSSSGGNILIDILEGLGRAAVGIIKGAVNFVKKVFKFFSDERMKTNIKYIRTRKDGVKIYQYEYKDEFKDMAGKSVYYGVLASEVEKIYPAAVSVHENGYKMVNYSLIGN